MPSDTVDSVMVMIYNHDSFQRLSPDQQLLCFAGKQLNRGAGESTLTLAQCDVHDGANLVVMMKCNGQPPKLRPLLVVLADDLVVGGGGGSKTVEIMVDLDRSTVQHVREMIQEKVGASLDQHVLMLGDADGVELADGSATLRGCGLSLVMEFSRLVAGTVHLVPSKRGSEGEMKASHGKEDAAAAEAVEAVVVEAVDMHQLLVGLKLERFEGALLAAGYEDLLCFDFAYMTIEDLIDELVDSVEGMKKPLARKLIRYLEPIAMANMPVAALQESLDDCVDDSNLPVASVVQLAGR